MEWLRYRLRRIYRWAVNRVDPRCPRCFQRLGGPMRMTPYGYCVECYSFLRDLREKWQ